MILRSPNLYETTSQGESLDIETHLTGPHLGLPRPLEQLHDLHLGLASVIVNYLVLDTHVLKSKDPVHRRRLMARSWFADLRRLNRNNVATLRAAPWAEISGSLGDLGTLLPLMIALAVQGSIDLGSTLVFSGIFNVLTGVGYGIPLPVQPMKVRFFDTYKDTSSEADIHRLLLRPPSLVVEIQLWASSPLRASGLVRRY